MRQEETMRLIKLYLVFLFILSFLNESYCQTNNKQTFRFPGEYHYKKAKIYLKNNLRFEVNDLKIVNDHLTYMQKNTFNTSECELDDIQIIKVSKGTYAAEYALYGGLVFALSSALAIAQTNADPYTEGSIDEGAFIGAFTAAGILIGGITGSLKPKWKTLFVNEQASLFNRPFQYGLNLKSTTNYIGLNFQITY